MKTPIPYYGGKLSMLNVILPLIPKHDIYVEPFCGGSSVFFAKETSKTSIINDTNGYVTNFFSVLKTNFDELKEKIEATPYGRVSYKVAMVMYRYGHLFTDVQRAVAFWVLTTQGFSGTIGSWSYDKEGRKVRTYNKRKLQFTKELSERLDNCQIESNDAIKVIQSRDSKNSFMFIDPPYVGADQGHYSGYTKEQFKNLLDALTELKGKFVLTTYDDEVLQDYVQKHGWYQRFIDKPITASKSKNGATRARKIEVITTNYKIETK